MTMFNAAANSCEEQVGNQPLVNPDSVRFHLLIILAF